MRNKLTHPALDTNRSLGERTVKGGLWIFSLRIVDRLFRFTRTIVLARLLAPKDFGLFAIAVLALSLLDTFSQTGFRQALIQKKGEVKSYLNTAWTIGLIRGLVIAGALFLVAPSAASFFDAPAAESIIKVIGISIILQNLTNISVIYFDKNLEFHKYFIYMSLGTIADLVVALSIAIIYRSVWALVFGRLAGEVTKCVISYLIHSYRPRPFLNPQKAKELFTFGKWILGSSILIFIATQGDDLFVGKFLGLETLGFYVLAYKIATLISTEISRPIMKVTFPAYSKLQDDLPKLREAYLKVLNFTTFLSLPIGGLIFATANNFTLTVLGEKWKPIIPLIMILIFRAMINTMRATLGPVTKAIGHPEIETKVTFIQVLVLAVGIYPAAKFFGITGVALIVVLQILVTYPLLLYLLLPRIKLSFRDYSKAIYFQFLSSVVMTVIVYVLQIQLPFNLITLCFEIALGGLIYIGLGLLFKRDNFKTFSYIKNQLNRT